MAKKSSRKKASSPRPVPKDHERMDQSEWLLLKSFTQTFLEVKSRIYAIEHVLLEVAEAAGLDSQSVAQALVQQKREWLQKAYENAENLNPGIAAELDERSLDEMP